MTNDQLQQAAMQFANDQLADQTDERITIQAAKYIEALVPILIDLEQQYRQVKISPATLRSTLPDKLSPGRMGFALRVAKTYRDEHVNLVAGIRKELSAVLEHVDKYGDEVYDKIDAL